MGRRYSGRGEAPETRALWGRSTLVKGYAFTGGGGTGVNCAVGPRRRLDGDRPERRAIYRSTWCPSSIYGSTPRLREAAQRPAVQ